ncbi:MAG: phage tail assembly chaperone [Rhodobacteraceae bacterium]|jgi:uncharacterized phage protein (TIGR02216 family)|nr:phage tail assembly chaperone [Paracoccaceae bacterium]
MGGFDWPGLMRAGMRGLGLAPDTFWALTPVELLVMLGLEAGSAPMTRAGLEALARDYPDDKQGGCDGRGRGSERSGGGAGRDAARGGGFDGGL